MVEQHPALTKLLQQAQVADELTDAIAQARAAILALGWFSYPGPNPAMRAALEAMLLPDSVWIVETRADEPDPVPDSDPVADPELPRTLLSPMTDEPEQRTHSPPGCFPDTDLSGKHPPSIKPYTGGRLKPEPRPEDDLRRRLEHTAWSLRVESDGRCTILKDGGPVYTDSLYGCERFAERLWLPIKTYGDLSL